MATIKHLAIKNRSFAFPLRYLTYQYDEHTNKPILDENKHMVLRDEYLIDAVGVMSPSTFQSECESWNAQCKKNKSDNEIKLHHYIISFDPKDKEMGLTTEKVQSLGMEIANKYFAGCQALVCTHPDGHNKSGNIHVHIVVNSVRKESIEKPDFIERESECKAGSKFRNSKLFLNSIRTGVMAICERENLNQVDLINPSEEVISEREYRKQQREQKKLDAQNAEMEADGIVPAKKIYQTEKDKIRKAIKRVIHIASDEEEFKELLKEQGIEVTESRGKWGYKTATLDKAIRARQFGTNYEKEYILSQLGSISIIKDIPDKYYGRVKKEINVQNAINAAETMKFLISNNLSSPEELLEKVSAAEAEYVKLQAKKDAIQEKLTLTNRMIHNTGCYHANKKIHDALLQTPKSQRESYQIQFSSQLNMFNKASTELEKDMATNGLKTIPKLSTLKNTKAMLIEEQESIESSYAKSKQTFDELNIIKKNYEKLLGEELVNNDTELQKRTYSSKDENSL